MGGLKRYVFYLGALTAVAIVSSIIFSFLAPATLVSPALIPIIVFFFLVLLVSRVIMLRVSEKSDQKFTQAFLAITVARFLLYLAIIITYSFLLRTDAVRFIISFFVFYLVFTVFEISYLYRDIHPRK